QSIEERQECSSRYRTDSERSGHLLADHQKIATHSQAHKKQSDQQHASCESRELLVVLALEHDAVKRGWHYQEDGPQCYGCEAGEMDVLRNRRSFIKPIHHHDG